MPPPFDYPSSTGVATLPDFGELSYNGVVFSSLFKSRASGKIVADDAQRTRKIVEWTLYAEGIVTLNDNEDTTDVNLDDLRFSLTEQGAELIFTGRGFGTFNLVPGPDLAWGPTPTLLEFTPYGQGRAAFVRWQVTVHYPQGTIGIGPLISTSFPLPQPRQLRTLKTTPFPPPAGEPEPEPEPPMGVILTATPPVLQFSWEYHLRYDEEGYSSYRINGILEIPLTRTAAGARALANTVDDFRKVWLDMPVELEHFRVTERSFDYAKDKRTVNWVYAVEELPPMGLPPGCTSARGTMSVRNTGGILNTKNFGKLTFTFWNVSLRCTYTVRGDVDRRLAWIAFASLLWFRVQQSRWSDVPLLNNPNPNLQQDAVKALNADNWFNRAVRAARAGTLPPGPTATFKAWDDLAKAARQNTPPPKESGAVIMTDFGFDEGLYLDSKTITFQASWALATKLTTLFAACGFTQYQPGTAGRDGNLWQQTVEDIMGSQSWNRNSLVAASDIIVDLGGGRPWGP